MNSPCLLIQGYSHSASIQGHTHDFCAFQSSVYTDQQAEVMPVNSTTVCVQECLQSSYNKLQHYIHSTHTLTLNLALLKSFALICLKMQQILHVLTIREPNKRVNPMEGTQREACIQQGVTLGQTRNIHSPSYTITIGLVKAVKQRVNAKIASMQDLISFSIRGSYNITHHCITLVC